MEENSSSRNSSPQHRIKSFVLRKGRITKGQKSALTRLGEKYIIPGTDLTELLKKHQKNFNKIIIEIGFGNGEATAAIAEKNKDIFYLGIEVYKAGVGNLLKLIEDKNLNNIGIISHDAVEILENLEGKIAFDGFHIFYPDPWHKSRHKKRRLINSSFAETLTSLIKPGGYIYAVTDWEDYSLQIINVLDSIDRLSRYSETDRFPWRPSTRFENKGIEKNHGVYDILYLRK